MMRFRCNGVAGWIFGHHLQPRYDEERTAPEWLFNLMTVQLSELASSQRAGTIEIRDQEPLQDVTRTYVGDICIRCGFLQRRDSNQLK
jgi:hypothetical protein